MKWKAVISDSDSLKKINQILNHVNYNLEQPKVSTTHLNDLMYGGLGKAIFLAYKYRLTPEESTINACTQLIEKSIEESLEDQPILNFGTGILGNIWGIGHLIEIGILDSTIAEIVDDDLLNEMLLHSKKQVDAGNYDYLLGGLGIVLLIQQVGVEKHSLYLKELIGALESISSWDQSRETCFWYQSSSISNPGNRLEIINMGIAHGLPSIILILNQLYLKGIEKNRIKRLIESCASWMLSKKSNIKVKESFYPYSFDSSGEFHPSGLRWCYGDLGIATSFYLTGISLQNEQLINFGLEIAEHCAKRSFHEKIKESHLCHGTAGVAHLFNRFYNYTNNQTFRIAAIHWFDQTIENFDPKLNTGFLGWKGTDNGWVEFDGLLEGSAGVGLALISAISNIEPKWDRCLLLS
jgi:lantibiotic modifying enzyme